MEQKNDRTLSFPEDTSDIIFEILKKYKLEETEKEIEEKLFGENKSPLKANIIATAVAKFYRKEISENDMPIIFKKEFGLSEDTAKNLANDVKTKIKPVAIIPEEIATEGPKNNFQEKDIFPAVNLSINEENISFSEKKIPEKNTKPQNIIKRTVTPPTEKLTTKAKGPDSYREPIE